MSEGSAAQADGFWADADGAEALDRYRALVNVVDDGIYQLDADGRFVAVNDIIVELTGYERDDLLGEHVSLVVDDADSERIEREIAARLETGETDRETIELTARTADGGAIPCELRLTLLTEDEDLKATIGIVRDVTERKRAEAITRRRELERELRERDEEFEQYETIVETIPDGAYVLDEDHRFRLVNETFAEMTGYDRSALLGTDAEIVSTEAGHERGRELREQLRTGEIDVAVLEETIDTADGEPFEAEIRFDALYDDGSFRGTAGVVRDISERKARERELEESRQRYRTLVENFPNGAVALVDEDLRYQTVGGNPKDTADMTVEEAEGAPVAEVLPSGLAEELVPRYEAALAGETSAFEFERDGQIFHFHVVPVRDQDDEVFAALGTSQDVTDRKRAELELQRNNEQLETLFEMLPVGVVVAAADGEIVHANDSAREIWGGDVFDADSVAEYDRYPVREADTGERVEPEEMTLARVLDGEEVTDPEVYEIDTVDGEQRVIEVEGMPIRDETGAVTRGVVVMSDITERSEFQRQLVESERRYRTIVENFPNGAVGMFDENLEYRAAGGEILADVGTDESEIVGTTIWERYPDDLAAKLEPKFEAALAGETNSFEIEFHGRHWKAYTLPVEDDEGDIFAGMMMVQDRSEQIEREQRLEELVDRLEESNQRLEQFAYAASHDMQEPLRMVSSYLTLIEQRYADDLDEDGREFLEFAVDGAERMREMIDGLLEYSRVDTRGDPFEPVDLDRVVADVEADLRMSIAESDATITTEDLPVVLGDRGQLRQLFQNLFDNAIEYSGDGPPRIHVGAERDGDEWTISVSDDGIGIDPDDADRVFEVFQRLHTREEHAGTGIGLALCERIVERHGVRPNSERQGSTGEQGEPVGGDIWLESEPGEGTTFYVTLPAPGDSDA